MIPAPDLTSWWRQTQPAELARAIWRKVDAIRSRRRAQNLDDLIYEAIYKGRPLSSARILGPSVRDQRTAPFTTLNVVQAKVDALTARMSKHRPFPVISCDDAGWSEKRFARRVSSVLRAKMGRQDIERDRLLRTRDAIVRGTGVAKITRTAVCGKHDVTVERVPRSEVIVGTRDALYGAPRSVYHLRSYPLEVLTARYPKQADKLKAIATAATYDSDEWYEWGDDWADDSLVVRLCEAYHLPSLDDDGELADDGRRSLVAKDLVLEDDEWCRRRHPFALLHYSPPMRGWFGDGLVSMLAAPQAKINDIARDIQEALYWGGGLKVFMPKGAMTKEQLSKRHPIVVEHNGTAPTYVAPNPVSQQAFQILEFLMNWCDDVSGLSRDFQSGKTQLGAGASGAAIDALDDITSDRLAGFQLFDSLSQVDIGQLIVDEARAIAKECPKAEQATWIREHKWDGLKIDEGLHHLRLEPQNFLPGTRAGRLAGATELFKAGLLDGDNMIELFEEPDLQRGNRKRLGPRRAVEMVMEGLCDPGVDLYQLIPDAMFPLKLGIDTAKAEYEDAWAGGADAAVLSRFREWIRLSQAKLDEAAAAAQPAGPGMAPPGAPPPAAPPGMPPGASPAAPPAMPMGA